MRNFEGRTPGMSAPLFGLTLTCGVFLGLLVLSEYRSADDPVRIFVLQPEVGPASGTTPSTMSTSPVDRHEAL